MSPTGDPKAGDYKPHVTKMILDPCHRFELPKTVLAVDEAVIQYHKCRACDYESEQETSNNVTLTCDEKLWKNHPAKLGTHKGKSVTQWINALLLQKTHLHCPNCNKTLQRVQRYNVSSSIISIVFEITGKVVIENQVFSAGSR